MWTANDLLGKAKDGSLRMKRDHYIFMQEAYKLVIEMRFFESHFFSFKIYCAAYPSYSLSNESI